MPRGSKQVAACQSPLLWALALLGAACSQGGAARQPETPRPAFPRPGDPKQELAVLEREYALFASQCSRTAEEVVDMQRRCSATRWADCVYAATMYVRGCGVAQDRAQADALFQRSCGFGSALGCTMAGGHTKDFEQGIGLLEKPCALGYPMACGYLGVQLNNRGKEADAARAAELIDMACREHDLQFCGVLGQVVVHWKLESRFEATRALLERACRYYDKGSCYLLAQTLEDGSLGAVDYERAAAINDSTCYRLDYLPACNQLGYMVVQGRGRDPDPVLGSMLFYEACMRGDGDACDSSGEAAEKGWGGSVSPGRALPFYDRGCKLESEHACQRATELRAAGVVESTGD